jgi:hypothetical protein
LFITANVLTVTSTSATKTMTKGLFIVASRPRRSLAGFSWFGNEPRVNNLAAALRQNLPFVAIN